MYGTPWHGEAAFASPASAALSIWSVGRSKNRASVVELAARQRTLAERYVEELLLSRSGASAVRVSSQA